MNADRMAGALSYAARGWAVFPLVPDAKRPAVADWERWATRDLDRIARYWSSRPGAGVGIACGPSGLAVLDLDRPKTPAGSPSPGSGRTGARVFLDMCQRVGEPVPRTFEVTTGRGGLHLYFAHPAGPELRNTAGQLGPLVDTRAHGGYVVAPPSTVDGRRYTVHRPRPLVPLPQWLTAALRPAQVPASQPVSVALTGAPSRMQASTHGRHRTRAEAYLEAAVQRECERVATATEGHRNRSLFLAAVALGQLAAGDAITDQQVYAALLAASADHVQADAFTANEARLTIRSGLRVGARRPRSVAA